MYQNLITAYTLAITSGGTLSGSVYLGGQALMAIASPGTWTASPLVFDVTTSAEPPGPGSWFRLYAGTVEATAYPATSGTAIYYLDVANVPAIYWLRGVSGAGAAGTAQAATRTLTALARPV